MVWSFSIPAVSYFRCLPLPSGGQVSRSASAPRKPGVHGPAADAVMGQDLG